jgi:hypothetical protein
MIEHPTINSLMTALAAPAWAAPAWAAPALAHVSPLERALLAASLVISLYALVRYWRSLGNRSRQVRYLLVSLRALALVLVSCALAGLKVDYASPARARVLLRSAPGVKAGAGGEQADARGLTAAREQMIAALGGKGYEVVEGGDDDARPDGIFLAGVLLTNGAMSAEEAEREVLKASEAAGGAPVYVLAGYPTAEEPGVALESVTVLGRAVRGVPVAVRCRIHARRMGGRESIVTVSDDAKVQASARVAWAGDDERQSVTFTLVPKVSGWVDYSAKVEAAGDEGEDLRSRPFSVYVEERRLRVLFFESEPTWEAKFIRRALEQPGLFEVDYSARVSRAAAVGMSQENGERGDEAADGSPQGAADRGTKGATAQPPEAKLRAALQSAAQLNAYDCVIVGATENTLLTAAESQRLREWVERRGGGLIVLGGNSFNGSVIAPGGKLYTLLPAETSAQGQASVEREAARGGGRPLEAEKSGAGVSLMPTEAGAGGALGGYLSATEGASGAAKDTLTGQGLRLGQLRPGATVLATAGARAGAGGNRGAALIAAMRYGAGRTLLFAPADSWRIRTSASGDENSAQGAFNALWQGLVLWAAAGTGTPAEIVLSDDAPAAGSTLTAEVHARDASFAPLKIEKLSARLQPLTEDAGAGGGGGSLSSDAARPREIEFAPGLTTEKGVWSARFTLPSPGRFVLEVEYEAGGRSGRLEKHFAVVAPVSREAGAASDTLSRASRESGGSLIDADAERLTERLAAIPSTEESTRRTWELRTWWPLAFLIPLLLSIEWFLRRRWRLD